MNDYNENWKPIEGYDDIYSVSDKGNVYSVRLKRNLKPIHNDKGYCYVILQRNKQRKQISIHRLVAGHFILNQWDKPQVNHIDGVKSNNEVGNLEWCTNEENRKHAIDNNLTAVGLGSVKEVDVSGIITDYLYNGYSIEQLVDEYSTSTTTVYRVFKEYNIQRRTASETRLLRTPITKEELHYKINEGLTNEELATWFRTSVSTIKRRKRTFKLNSSTQKGIV